MKIPASIKNSKIWQNYIKFIGVKLTLLRYRDMYEEWKSTAMDKLESVVQLADFHGLCDRLKVATSTYYVCKKLNKPFKLLFTNPFDIRIFLEPNKYDWRIDESQVNSIGTSCEMLDFTKLVMLYPQYVTINKIIKERIAKAKVKYLFIRSYVATGFVEKAFNFSEIFNELFRPTKLVQDQLDYYNNKIIQGGGILVYLRASRD